MHFRKFALGLISTGVLTLNLPTKFVLALAPEEISQIAEQITVLIDGQNPGSGVIIAKEGTTYYILTAKHVVETEDEYTIQTPDGRRYPLDYSKVIKSPDTDLAIIPFESTADYEVATLGNSNEVSMGSEVHIYGFPHSSRDVFQYEDGKIIVFPPESLQDGYQLVYGNDTEVGMSGGPVLDNDGELIGVHGRGLPNTLSGIVSQKMASLGIPINTFHRFLIQTGLDIDPVGEAIAILNQPNPNRTRSSSDEFQTWLAKGFESLLLASDYEAAVRNFDRALQIDPDDDDDAWFYHALSLAKLGHDQEALASYDRALQIDPNFADAWSNRGVSLGNLGRYQEALASYDRALQIDPNDAMVWNNRGFSLAELGRYQEALASYDRALRIDPNHALARQNRNIALKKLGR